MCSSMNALRRFCNSFTRGEYSKSICLLLCGFAASLQYFLDLQPAELCQQRRFRSGLDCMRARRGAIDHSLGDALRDARDAEQVVGHVEIPGRRVDLRA